jgi:hypothetical protein
MGEGMSTKDPRWAVRLEGEHADLADLERLMNAPELLVVERDGSFYLESMGFEHLSSPPDVLAAARRLIDALSGLARLKMPLIRPFTATAVVERDDSGATKTHQFVFPESARLRLRAFAPTVTVTGGAPAASPAPSSLGAELALDDERVASALRIYGQEPTWVGLYQVWDVIQPEAKAWVSASDIERFRWTANNFRALGSAARHARLDWKPPANPMSLEEAARLIGGLLERWLAEKLALAKP